MPISRDAILGHSGVPKTIEVHVPNWADQNGDDVVLVRSMTSREFEVNQSKAAKDDDGKASAWVLARCVMSPDGMRLFEDADIDRIAELSVGDVSLVLDAVMKVSGLTEESRKEIAKNSVSGQTGSSSSGSPQTSTTATPTTSTTDSPPES